MATINQRIENIKKELDEILRDPQYNNLVSFPVAELSKKEQAVLRKCDRSVDRLQHEYRLLLRARKIMNEEIFHLGDIWECQAEIGEKYPQYKEPIRAGCGILFAARIIQLSFGKRYYLLFYKYPIKIDFETSDAKVYVIHPGNFIRHYKKDE